MQEGRLFFDVAVSLDGFIAPDGMDMAHANDPSYKNWMSQWGELQSWVFQQKFFRENLKLGQGGETGVENQMLVDTFKRTGASIMGKRMFDGGEHFWPEEAPFHTPVFVLTHLAREPWPRPGGTTFHFVNDGMRKALSQAQKASAGKDIRVAGGANTIQQFLNAGLIDEFTLHYSPVLFGQGVPLLAKIDPSLKPRVRSVVASKNNVTHVTYDIEKAA